MITGVSVRAGILPSSLAVSIKGGTEQVSMEKGNKLADLSIWSCKPEDGKNGEGVKDGTET